MTIVKDSTNDDLKIMSGDSGFLEVSGLSTDDNLEVIFWLVDPETAASVLNKSVHSNSQATATIAITSSDTEQLCTHGSSKVYNYGITLTGETYGTHTVIPIIGETKHFIVYRSGYKSNV